MSTESSTIVQSLWNYCNVLRDDCVSYGDYVEQLAYLAFLEMADEQTRPPLTRLRKSCKARTGRACLPETALEQFRGIEDELKDAN